MQAFFFSSHNQDAAPLVRGCNVGRATDNALPLLLTSPCLVTRSLCPYLARRERGLFPFRFGMTVRQSSDFFPPRTLERPWASFPENKIRNVPPRRGGSIRRDKKPLPEKDPTISGGEMIFLPEKNTPRTFFLFSFLGVYSSFPSRTTSPPVFLIEGNKEDSPPFFLLFSPPLPGR